MRTVLKKSLNTVMVGGLVLSGCSAVMLNTDNVLPGGVQLAYADEITPDSGNYNGVDWSVDSDGVLTIGAEGQEQTISHSGWIMNGASNSWAPWYSHNNEITAVKIAGVVNFAGDTVCNSLFYNMPNCKSIDLTGAKIDSSVKYATWMFRGCNAVETINLGDGFNTSNMTDMSYMFYGCGNLADLSLGGNFDTTNVTNMSYMFYGLEKLTSLDLGGKFNTSKVWDMSRMFAYCGNLGNLNLGDNFDTSNVTNMQYMFSGLRSLEHFSLGEKFNTSKVTDMSFMFSSFGPKVETTWADLWNGNKFAFETLDLGDNFDTSNVTTMKNMFSGFRGQYIDFGDKFDTSKVKDMSYMFSGASYLSSLDLSQFDTSNVTSMNRFFGDNVRMTSVTFGDKFTKWTDESYLTDLNKQGKPGTYNGKYHNKATNLGAKTPEELYNELPKNPSAYAGTWEALGTSKDLLVATINSIEYVKTSIDGKDISPEEYWTTWEERNTIDLIVYEAIDMLRNNAPDADWDGEIEKVEAGKAVYYDTKKSGLMTEETFKEEIVEAKEDLDMTPVSLCSGRDMKMNVLWVTQESHDEYADAILEAKTVSLNLDDNDLYEDGVAPLRAASTKFNLSKIAGEIVSNEPESGDQTGTGKTELQVQLMNEQEHSGTDDPSNPDDDGDGFGDNIAFTTPSEINFVVKPNGDLIAPSADKMFLENESVFEIHVSSMQATPVDDWNVVEDAKSIVDDGTNSTKNLVSIKMTPNGVIAGEVNLADYLAKIALPSNWNMSPSIIGDAVVSDRIQLGIDGQMNNVSKDLSEKTKFTEIEWYVTPGVK